MGFASSYINERALFPELFKEAPEKHTGIIVVVPAYNESGLPLLLDSLCKCEPPGCAVEVIIIINAPHDAQETIIENNKKAFNELTSWKKQNSKSFFRLLVCDTGDHSFTKWGVGMARKTGMDEAARRFNFLNRPDGVILCLDADCTISENYLISVQHELMERKDRSACSIYFEHPFSGSIETIEDKCIIFYELHLRYYVQGLAYCNFPYCYHTVGSSMAVKALSYVKVGGMNRNQAGEDFYFIQKLVSAGNYFSLITPTVYPSSRSSQRVPFGTGASIDKLTNEKSPTFFTYDPESFNDLKNLFDLVDNFQESTIEDITGLYNEFPIGIRSFLGKEEMIHKLLEIKSNTSSQAAFRKRFFDWFNMFKIVKYLNFVHINIYRKLPVEIATVELLRMKGIILPSDISYDLLLYFRELEKKT